MHISTSADYTNTRRNREENCLYRRDALILTHQQGSSEIKVFQCSPWTEDIVTSTIPYDNTIAVNSELVLGAHKNTSGVVSDYGQGIIYECKLWNNYCMRIDDCRTLLNWTGEQVSFDVIGKETSTIDASADLYSHIDLMTSGSLHFPRRAGTSGSTFVKGATTD